MHIRRFAASMAAVAVAAAGVGLVTAPAALGATESLDCSTSLGETYTLAPGETLTLTATNCYDFLGVSGDPQYGQSLSATFDPGGAVVFCSLTFEIGCPTSQSGSTRLVSVTFVAPDVEQASILRFATYSIAPSYVGISIAVVTPDPTPTPDTTPGSTSTPIPAWVQAYGRDGKDATCLDGWDASWQSWAESVTGGWVCTRNIPSLG